MTRLSDNALVLQETLESPLLLNYHLNDYSKIAVREKYFVEITSVVDGRHYQGTTNEWTFNYCLHSNQVDLQGVTISYECTEDTEAGNFVSAMIVLWVYNRPFDNHTIAEYASRQTSHHFPMYKGDLYVYMVIGLYDDGSYTCEESGALAFIEVIPIDSVTAANEPAGTLEGTLFVDRPETVFTITVSNTQVRNYLY